MENTEIKSGTRIVRNKIVLRNLTKEQKELLSSGGIIAGGIGLGGGLFTLYSMKEPDAIPGIQPTVGLESTSSEITNSETTVQTEPVVLYSEKPIHEVDNENISFGEAFKVARSICGPGGWFIWKDNIYNTYYKEEWQSMPANQRQEYIASLNVQDEPQPLAETDTITEESIQSIEQPTLTEPELTSDTFPGQILADETETKNEVIEETKPLTNTVQEVSIDFSALYGNKNEKSEANPEPKIETVTASNSGELVHGEIINLDDETDLHQQDIFELEDDIEIILLPETESLELDSLVMDSNQITEFPWGEKAGETDTRATTEEPVISTNTNIEEASVAENIPEENSKEEYPWGEPVVIKAAEIAEPGVKQEQEEVVIASTITKPEEITEYPWGERVEETNQISGVIATEPEGKEISAEEGQPQVVSSFDEIEEFPWGEKNIQFNPESKLNTQVVEGIIHPDKENENIGVIINDNSEPILHEQLPSSFNDITEFPWGESILNSPVGYNTGSNNPDNVIDQFDDPTHSLTDEPQ